MFNANYILTAIFFLSFLTISTSQEIDKNHPTYLPALQSLGQLKEFLAIPNDANFPNDIELNVKWCETKLGNLGMELNRLETETVPLLLASKVINQELPTLMYYFHIDGQPVDPQYWFQDSPYDATMKEEVEGQGWVTLDWNESISGEINPDWRIFARSSSDDKSPFIMFLTILENMKEGDLAYNLKVILDFEEEKGSPRLAAAVEENRDLLKADALVIIDGPKHPSNLPTLSFGARGITTVTLKVFGPTFPLHSGHYGNFAPNPALRLSKLLGSMKDDYGRVVIPGFYEGINLDQPTKEILASVPDDLNKMKVKLGIGEIDSVGHNYQEALQYPSLNIRGLSSGWVGSEARTIVPATATAEIDIRLVVESPPERQVELLRNHVESQSYFIVEKKPSSQERFLHPKICQFTNDRAYTAFRTSFDSPLGKWADDALKNEFSLDPIKIRTMGGSLPISPFINVLGIPAVIVPMVNSDNNQHSPNENLRLGNYFDGVRTFNALLNKEFKSQ